MKIFAKATFAATLASILLAPTLSLTAKAETTDPTTATGYTSAREVEYVEKNGYIANWGARGETATFLSVYAQEYYVEDYQYSVMSQNAGGRSYVDAPNSALYTALKDMMTVKHTKIGVYEDTKEQYRYTDCVRSDYTQISCFYSGKMYTGDWNSGKIWNREHTWPQSKCLGPKDKQDKGDIMMLRPSSSSLNSGRGNDAYGMSSGYYNPNQNFAKTMPGGDVRGDCARNLLYGYVRWGNAQYMWGKSGVIESMDVLLEWMKADPVDTWEMGRNDAVQSITGVRNVFIDYPEYAWALFGKELPTSMSTPLQGKAEECKHVYGDWIEDIPATSETEGKGHRICKYCGDREDGTLPVLTDDEILAGCFASLGSTAGIISLALAGAYVLKKRK